MTIKLKKRKVSKKNTESLREQGYYRIEGCGGSGYWRKVVGCTVYVIKEDGMRGCGRTRSCGDDTVSSCGGTTRGC